MKLRWSHRARSDLAQIADFIALDDPAAARRWAAGVQATARAAARRPHSGRAVPEWSRPDLRETLLRSYRIICAVRAREIWILTVTEGHRLLPSLADLDD